MKEIATTLDLNTKNFSTFVRRLNSEGFLLKKGYKNYELYYD
jgi:Mn-dependent DtxR family transcriptional regulator